MQTERCLIRQFKDCDIDGFMKYRNNMDWMRYQGFKGLTRQEYEDELLRENSPETGIQLAIIQKSSQTLIGDLYLKQENGEFWIGCTICPSKARQGYACEAVTALIATLKAKSAARIKAGAEPGNTASFALLKKLDFHYSELSENEQIFTLQ